MGVDVRYGSLADILTSPRHVRFSPITDVERGGSKSAFAYRFMSTRLAPPP